MEEVEQMIDSTDGTSILVLEGLESQFTHLRFFFYLFYVIP